MKKKESALKQMLDKYHSQIENSKVGMAKNIKLIANNPTTNPKSKAIKAKLDNNHNKSQSNEIVAVKEIRNKNLEQMLKKLNSQNNLYENLHSNMSSNNFSNNSSFVNKSYQINNNNVHNNASFYSATAKSEMVLKDGNNDSKNILSLLRKSKNSNKSDKNSEKLFQKTTDTLIILPFTQNNNLNTINSSNNNPINSNTNTINQNEIIKTSKETTNVVNAIDSRIKQLKLKFLRDTHIDLKRLSKYNRTMVKIYSFLTSYEINSIYHSCKLAHDNIKNYLKTNIYKYILVPFTEIYNNQFKIENSNILFKFEKNNFNVILIIKGKIILNSSYENNTIELSNCFSFLNHQQVGSNNNSKIFRNIYRFDYKHKTYSKQLWWVLKEKTYFNYDEVNRAYAMPIIPFKYGDTFEISISLISYCGMINFGDFKWKKIRNFKMTNVDYLNYNNLAIKKEKDKQLCDFDLSRFCEMELIKTKWINYVKFPNIGNSNEIKNEIGNFCNKLMGFFTIENIEFDDVGFYIFKIYTKAVYMGTINENDIGIGVDIKGNKEPCYNEIRKNGLIYDNGKGIEIRLGDKIVFYLTMNKTVNE